MWNGKKPCYFKSLTLTCSIGDSTTTPHDRVGHLIDALTRRRATNDIKFVSSLVVLRDGTDIASLSEHVPATAFADLDNMVVNGSIPGTSGELALLTLRWDHPKLNQQGNYTCQVTGYDQIGHAVLFFGSASVEMVAPTTDDLVYQIYTQELHGKKLNDELSFLKTELQNASSIIDGLKTRVGSLENETDTLKLQLARHDPEGNYTRSCFVQDLYDINAKFNQSQETILHAMHTQDERMTDLEVNLTRSTHMETGNVNCSWLGHGEGHSYTTLKGVHVGFTVPYEHVPDVVVAIADVWTYKDYDAKFGVTASKVTSDGFTVQCYVYSSSDYIGYFYVNWISVP